MGDAGAKVHNSRDLHIHEISDHTRISIYGPCIYLEGPGFCRGFDALYKIGPIPFGAEDLCPLNSSPDHMVQCPRGV